MSVPLLALLGAGVGVGLVLLAASLRPSPVPLRDALTRVATPRPLLSDLPHRERLLTSLARAIGLERLVGTSVRRDLRALDRTVDDHLARSLLTAVELGLAPAALAGVVAATTSELSVGVPAAVCVTGAVVGALLPTALVHREAERRRRSFKHALGAFFNLVGLNIAAGRGIEAALVTAAEAGDGEAFAQLRTALYRARVAGRTPWSGLDALGDEIGVAELQELAAAVGLAGDIGARVRASLAAKAETLRRRGVAEIEEEATAASERMALPVVLLVLSFIAFIGYPAVDRIMTGL